MDGCRYQDAISVAIHVLDEKWMERKTMPLPVLLLDVLMQQGKDVKGWEILQDRWKLYESIL